ncbi:MAG TPA: DUF4126 domain-containing protein [Thermomicrobiales bacterium]|nr:DUF4126 domain-containing protein [Thermomicrobiales bacterium]
MDPILTGVGLAGAAGLNAYIPLLALALAGRFGFAQLNAPYDALSSNWGLAVLLVLLGVEVLADKIPGVDHVNDIINTVIRPAAGAVLMLASAGAGTLNPGLAVALGLLCAGGIHGLKASARPLVTVSTAGIGNPVVSVGEDIAAMALSVLAFVAPVAVAILVALLLLALVLFLRALRARRARRAAA